MNQFIYALLCTSLLCIANIIPRSVYAAELISFEILTERTHKPTLFTQGLLVDGDYFYESSGLYEKSLLVSYPIAEPDSNWAKISAPFTKKQSIPARYFAEGLALLDNKLYLLTWQEQTLLIYDKATLNYQKSITYKGEGWGLTSDGKQLIRSDGSDALYFHKPDDFSVIKTVRVIDGGTAISQLNELEYAGGFLWANIWHADRIVKIDPATGKVLGEINLVTLKEKLQLGNTEKVLNGIAWDEKRQAFWITGKNWPKMFLIHIKH